MSEIEKEFYTVSEVAELLKVNKITIYNLVKANKITVYKIGAQIRIPSSEIERLKVERSN